MFTSLSTKCSVRGNANKNVITIAWHQHALTFLSCSDYIQSVKTNQILYYKDTYTAIQSLMANVWYLSSSSPCGNKAWDSLLASVSCPLQRIMSVHENTLRAKLDTLSSIKSVRYVSLPRPIALYYAEYFGLLQNKSCLPYLFIVFIYFLINHLFSSLIRLESLYLSKHNHKQSHTQLTCTSKWERKPEILIPCIPSTPGLVCKHDFRFNVQYNVCYGGHSEYCR